LDSVRVLFVEQTVFTFGMRNNEFQGITQLH